MDMFSDFDNVLQPEGMLTIIFLENNKKQFCQARIKRVVSDMIYLDMTISPRIDKEQVLSVIYTSDLGLYGFHAKLACDDQKHMCIGKPRSGWRIQRRQCERMVFLPTNIKVTSFSKGEVVSDPTHAFILNISESGMGLATDLPFNIDEKIAISFTYELWDITQKCVVVWCSKNTSDTFSGAYVYGIKFLEITPTMIEVIHALKTQAHIATL